MLYKNKDWFEKKAEEGLSATDIANGCGVDRNTIVYWAKKHNVHLVRKTPNARKNKFKEDFFETIDTEEKAYILGFIMADGWVGSGNRTIEIKLHEKDVDLLNKINSALNSNISLKHRKGKSGDYKLLTLSSKKLVNDLFQYGITQKKSHKIPFPKICDELYRHFIRGYFDGDGHVGYRQCALVISSELFMRGFLIFLYHKFNYRPWYKEKESYYHVQFSKKDAWFIQWMYKESELYLDRKKQSFNKYWSMLK